MDLTRWQVFSNLSRDLITEVRLAYTWGAAKGGYFVTNNDDVYCIGEHKSRERKRRLPSPKKMDALCGKGIKSFHYGQSQTFALTNSGKLYQWNICYDNEPTIVTGFVPENVNISQVAVGELHMLALTSEGKVYSWGANTYGQLGSGSNVQNHHPQHVTLNKRIVSVACSQAASFALTEEGDVLSWGRVKQNGQTTSDVRLPGTLLRSKSVSQIVGGQLQGLGLADDGKLYCWGIEDGTRRTSPREICKDIGPIVEIAGNFQNDFFVCRTASQEVFIWGKWFGQTLKEPFKTKYKSVDEAFACSYVPTMWRTLAVQRPSHFNVLKSFESAFNDEDTSDVEFIVDGKKIFAHRVFLKFRVPYFRTMYENQWKDSNQRVIKVEKFTYDVFSAFLTYVYTERVEVKAYADLYGLLEAADYYNVQDLLTKCEDLLKAGIQEGNVCTVYALAVRHNAKNLQSYTREYIIPRFSKVVESKDFSEMDPLISNQLIRELAHKRKLVDASGETSMGKRPRLWGNDNGSLNQDKNRVQVKGRSWLLDSMNRLENNRDYELSDSSTASSSNSSSDSSSDSSSSEDDD